MPEPQRRGAGLEQIAMALCDVTVRRGNQAIELHLVSQNGLPGSFLDAARNVKIPLDKLPAGLTLTGKLSSSSGGIVAHVFARTLAFG